MSITPSSYCFALAVCFGLWGCIPEAADDDGGAGEQMQPTVGGAPEPGAGGLMQPSAGGEMQPSAGGAMQPSAGGAMQPSAGGDMQPSAGGNVQPNMGGMPAPDGPCDYRAGEGRWTHLPNADMCLYYSNVRATFRGAVEGCRDLGTELPDGATLDALCDEIVLRPGDLLEGRQRATSVRVRDVHQMYHRLWQDRGATERALECGLEAEECGVMGLSPSCGPSNLVANDSTRLYYACLRPANDPPPPPGTAPLDGAVPPAAMDAGIPDDEDAARPPLADAFVRRDMAPAPAVIADTRWQERPGRPPPDELTRETRAHFYFEGDRHAVSFECQLNDGPWFECQSPFTVDPAEEGENIFRVAAINADGDPDRTPLEYTWTVDTRAPDCRLTDTRTIRGGRGAPGCGPGSGFQITFNMEDGAQHQCRRTLVANSGRSMSEGNWFNCASPYTFNFACAGLRRTSILTYLRITDAAGNTCESGPAHGPTWSCDDC